MMRASVSKHSLRLALLGAAFLAAASAVPAVAQGPEVLAREPTQDELVGRGVPVEDEISARGAAPVREINLVIYGDDRCPPSTEDEVVVCARRPETERYRVPPRLRHGTRGPEQSWASRVESLEDAQRDTRPNSCSVVGTYGQSGCTAALIRQWYAERRARSQRGY